jgi:hypothetical protein
LVIGDWLLVIGYGKKDNRGHIRMGIGRRLVHDLALGGG